VGSRSDAEKALEQELEKTRVTLLTGAGPRGLLRALQSLFPDLSDNVYIIAHVPEQCEDIYDVLVDATTVVHVEIPRAGISQDVVVEEISMKRYWEFHSTRRSLAKRRVDAALLLAWQRRPT
jgi:hypothetical protein